MYSRYDAREEERRSRSKDAIERERRRGEGKRCDGMRDGRGGEGYARERERERWEGGGISSKGRRVGSISVRVVKREESKEKTKKKQVCKTSNAKLPTAESNQNQTK